ncbi:MAG: CARDB domain-containing protein [Euryarchaeota archaeon]|nr:CARDB domain-containing protein [Euryarchaeota archaeon]
MRTSNEIEYNLNKHPLKDQTLTGNKFWDLRETEPLPAPKGPDLAILSAENWAFEDDGRVLQLLVKIANHGDTRANQTRVYVGDPQHDWPGRESVVPTFNPEETGTIEIRLDIPEEQRGTTHVFMLELDPEDMIQEIDERNNVGWTPGIFIPPLEVSPTPTEPTSSPTATPVLPEPDPVPLILIVVTIASLACITLIIRHHTITQHHKKWQMEAKEEEPPEHCQYCTHHCRKIELELEPAMRKITYLYLGAYDPVHGEQIKEGQVTGEIVEGLNKVVSARHRRENAEKLQEQVTLLAHALLQQIIGSLRDELAPRDITITGHLGGGKVTCQFILYHCKRSGTMNIWEEEAKWKATIADERDEPVGTLHSIDPVESGISERLTPVLTRLLMQFIEKV